MANQLLIAHFKCLVTAAKAKARVISDITHPSLRGKFRESLAEDLLRPILPTGGNIGTGKIIDCNGGQSNECDLVIYHRDVLPPTLYEPRSGLFPVEACLYAIEVKSKLSADEVGDAILKFRQMRQLRVNSAAAGPITVLFAFDSDLVGSGKSELERYIEKDAVAATDPAVCVICVIGKGYWYFDHPGQRWHYFAPTDDNQEVIDFIGGVANTIPGLWMKRLTIPFGRYIVRKQI